MKSQRGSSLWEVKLFSQYDEYFFKIELREAKHTFVKNTLMVSRKKGNATNYSVSTEGLSTCHVV